MMYFLAVTTVILVLAILGFFDNTDSAAHKMHAIWLCGIVLVVIYMTHLSTIKHIDRWEEVHHGLHD